MNDVKKYFDIANECIDSMSKIKLGAMSIDYGETDFKITRRNYYGTVFYEAQFILEYISFPFTTGTFNKKIELKDVGLVFNGGRTFKITTGSHVSLLEQLQIENEYTHNIQMVIRKSNTSARYIIPVHYKDCVIIEGEKGKGLARRFAGCIFMEK